MDFRNYKNGVMRFKDRVFVSNLPELKNKILEEGHKNGLSIHPGAMKMYQDLKNMFWWLGMKKDVVEFVYSCLTCQKLKIEHQKVKIDTTVEYSEVEIGQHFYGFCDEFA